jgi:heme exporter protein C
MHRYANPTLYGRIVDRVRRPAGLAGLALILVGLYLGLFVAPPDYQQGESFRIMYVHVPAAWMAMFSYAGLAVSSAVYLIWRHGVADVTAKAIAPAGAAFTAIALVTGSLWGQPMWGTWWVWDARLTSVLLLFFLYLGYMVLRDAFDAPERGAKASAILAVVGVVNLPIIKFSVDWWNTLHQPATISKLDAPSIHPSMLWPLLAMALGFTLIFVAIVCLRARTELLERRARSLEMQAALSRAE